MSNNNTFPLQSHAITKKEERPNSRIELKVENDELIDVKTGESTGKNYEECFKVMLKNKDNITLNQYDRLEGECNDSECQACMDAFNAAIITVTWIET
ncbi:MULTISPECIES: hypothetical protein [unclassified Wolbachia]|uniref:hypothetical protein n=1 Tax=unclassified Wolbachia TaxID=2640676 RepID=UPI00221F9006|nr:MULTISPECIES: hypothetical protein [unclassified Wolbachia]